ncbi:MAG: sigma-70 family RNA polymerase sigma factor [Bacteroidales bacterium]|nr:sigma-70 family RNA polymerase sigma factor [Bacteroidales bacterium]
MKRIEELLLLPKTEEVVTELIELNQGLIHAQLRKFYLEDDLDAISFAYEALFNAILNFKPNKNNKFSTYATVCIYNRLGSYVRSINTQAILNTISCNQPINEDDEDGMTLLDTFESPFTAEDEAIASHGVNNILQSLKECYNALKNPLHKRIVGAWIESNFGKTHTKIAEELQCSQAYVTQVLKTFKNTLKNKLEEME